MSAAAGSPFSIPASESPAVFLMTNSFETGGSERQFRALAESLDRARYRVQLGCIAQEGAFREGLDEVSSFPLEGNLYNFRSWRTRWRLARHLRRREIAVAHAFDFYTNLVLIPAARWARVPVVIGSQRQLGDLLTSGKSRAQTAVLRWCDAVICNSRAAAEGLVRRGVPEPRLIVIPNGLPEAAFAPQPPAITRVPGTIRAVMLARMNTRSKNHSLLLRATGRLRDRVPNLELLLVGDGSLRPDLEREAEALGIRDRVQFLGERHDVAAVLRSADISVLPSISESLSNAIIESMAAELPVIACRVGGNPELVNEQTGMLVAPDNEEEFAEAIANLARNPAKRVELGDTARKIARAQYTIAGMCQRHEALYAELLERKQWQPMRTRSLPGAQPLSVAVVAASLRYVGGQSVQADLLLRNWRVDSAVDANVFLDYARW